jgi:hypothetical protein
MLMQIVKNPREVIQKLSGLEGKNKNNDDTTNPFEVLMPN